jgi:hypothetical protein
MLDSGHEPAKKKEDREGHVLNEDTG